MIALRHLPYLLCCLALSGCQPKPQADQGTAAASAIREADTAWEKAVSSHDTTAAVAAVESTGAILPPNAPAATGPQEIRTLFEGYYAIPNMVLHWVPADVGAAQSGDLGYSRGTYELTFTDTTGKPVTDHGKYATVWRRQTDGSWKVVLDIFNSDLAAPGK